MSKDAKDPKHRPDGLRQPQRKDSLSSVLSWAALQGKITPSKTPTASPSTSQSTQSSQSSPGTTSRPRRHSHSAGSETKTKARRGSTTFRRLSFSAPTTTQGGTSTKTRHAKTPMAPDPKASPGTSKSGKNGSSEKVNKAASDSSDGTTPNRPQTAKSRSMSSPICMPKSILRVSSPDGDRRPRQFVNPQTGEPTSPGLPPSSPVFGSISPDSPPGSPPTSPIPRPMSPGATVRFAKATIHRVEVGPGRRFLPVKRKSKSTLTYISPLDPGTQKSAPKTMLQSPTKMRRHQENQAAMGRYWLRTEEEEAQWRAEAERRAQEEAEKYRNEPASSPPPAASVAPKADEEAGGAVQSSLADAMAAIDKLPPLDSGPALEKVEEEVMESEDEDEGAGAKCNPVEAAEAISQNSPAEEKLEADALGLVAKGEHVATEDIKSPARQTQPETSPSPASAHTEASETNPTVTAAAHPEPTAEPVAKPAEPAPTATPAPPASTQPSPDAVTLAESRSFFERLAEKQAADERARRAPSPPAAPSTSPQQTTQPPAEAPKPLRSSSSSLSKQKPAPATPTGRSSSASTGSSSSSSSAEQLTKTPSREKEKGKEKDKERDRAKEKTRSSTNLRSASGGSGSGSGSGMSKGTTTTTTATGRTDRTLAAAGAGTSARGSSSSSHNHSSSHSHNHSHSHSGSNHLHLSGRRGRRYFEDRERERQGQRQGITA